jgi:hypothetical protein
MCSCSGGLCVTGLRRGSRDRDRAGAPGQVLRGRTADLPPQPVRLIRSRTPRPDKANRENSAHHQPRGISMIAKTSQFEQTANPLRHETPGPRRRARTSHSYPLFSQCCVVKGRGIVVAADALHVSHSASRKTFRTLVFAPFPPRRSADQLPFPAPALPLSSCGRHSCGPGKA